MKPFNKWRQMHIQSLGDLLSYTIVDSATGCMIWQRGLTRRNYGSARYGGRQWRTHRLAFFFATGTNPAGKCVCHKCDNPRCVNPDHLFLGTHQDNMHDMKAKGRAKAGPNAGAYLRERATCQRGHPWTAENTMWIKASKNRYRRCKECTRRRNKTTRRVHSRERAA